MRILRIILSILFFPTALFVPAGRIDWPEAWAFILVFYTVAVSLRFWIAGRNPGLQKERNRHASDVEKWDTVLMGIYPVLLLAMLVISALDSGRFGWSNVPMRVRILGWIGLGIAGIIVWWVMSANPFASRWVRIQEDRGHTVIMEGPYRYVRHPMYVGIIIFVISVPILLDSWWGLFPGVATGLLFVYRTVLEERTLLLNLPGYADYALRVRYRLIPGIW